jgi:osmotically-inducible protein OsmY
MRTDNELRTDVVAELSWDPSIRDEDIATAVKDGVVTLAGLVDTYAQRHSAERAVQRVKGVKAIVNDLTVKLQMDRSDVDLAHSAVNAFRWNVEVPAERIQVKVANGWLTLEGEVDWYYHKEAAESAVRYLMGVKGVNNQITVETNGSRITLRGTVRSPAERRDAERAAWNAPGVTRVENDVHVSPPVVVAL